MDCKVLILLTVATCGFAYPKYETEDKGFVPSKGDFFHANEDQIAMETRPTGNQTETSKPAARYGFQTYSTDVQNYPQNVNNVVPGVYGPVKLDIGGLVLGTIVGLGAFFILPKLLHVVSAPYGGFKRSEDEENGNGIGLTDMYNKIQQTLESYNVDSTACLQRAICSSIQTADEKISNKTSNKLDNVVDNVAKNDLVKSFLDGTEWQKAVDAAERGDNCSSVFTKCPFTVDSVVNAIAKYIAS